MKKLLYLIPLLLVILCATPFALYKDTVTHGTSLDSASPRHWKILSVDMSYSGSLDRGSSILQELQPAPPAPYSQAATFKGFPIGAYFNRSSTSNGPVSSSSFSVSAVSWLWSTLDILLILATLYYAISVNRKTK